MPYKRYNIFAGTNTVQEWFVMARLWFDGDRFTSAKPIEAYEKASAQVCGVKHAISFGSGRMALYAILEALDIGDGDEVIIPAFTCVVVANAILYRKARPVYVDIEPRFFNIDVTKIERAITPRTRALYAQHTFGIPCEVDALRELGGRFGLPIIEDAAHALGASYQGKPIGSLTEVGFFSSDHSKVINTHLGGMALTNDGGLAARLRRIQASSPFLDKKIVRRIILSFLLECFCFAPHVLWFGKFFHALLTRKGILFFFLDELEITRPAAYPCRLSSVQAQLGLMQLEILEKNLSHRRKISKYLERKIGWNQLPSNELENYAWLRYSFLVKDRMQFEGTFKKHFDLGVWFTSVVGGRQRDFEAVHYRPGSCPVAEYIANHIVNFPTHLRIPIDVIEEEIKCRWSDIAPNILYDRIGERSHA